MGFNFGAMASGFVSGYEAGDKMQTNKAQREYMKQRGEYLKSQMDPEMQSAKLAHLKAQTAAALTNSQSLNAYRSNSMGIAGQRLKMDQELHNLQMHPEQTPIDAAPPRPQSALPINPVAQNEEGDAPGTGFSVAQGDDDNQDEQSLSRGGVVRAIPHYADGGDVTDPENDPEEEAPASDEGEDNAPEETGRRYAEAAIPSAATPVQYNKQAGHDAALAGMKYNLDLRDVAQGQGIDLSAKSRGGGALGPKRMPARDLHPMPTTGQMEQLKDKVDPGHTLSDAERTSAVFAGMWQYNLKRGDTHGAEQAAAAMVNYQAAQFNRYKAIAEAAASKGDPDTAINAAVKAYEQVPDGQKIDVKKDDKGNYSYSLTDENGKTMQRQVMSPDQVLSWMTRGGIPNFTQLMVTASGNRAQPAAKAASTPKLSDRLNAEKAISAEAGDTDAVTGAPKYSGVTDDQKAVASHIMVGNDIGKGDALKASGNILDVSKPLPGTLNDDGSATITPKDGPAINVSKEAYTRILAIRGQAKKAQADKAKADQADADKHTAVKAQADAARGPADARRIARRSNYDQARRQMPWSPQSAQPIADEPNP